MNKKSFLIFAAIICLPFSGAFGKHLLNLGPEEIVQASGSDIDFEGVSVPLLVQWDNDELPDLIVGETVNNGSTVGKIRRYYNYGTIEAPSFSGFAYVTADGIDIEVPVLDSSMGAAPWFEDWDGDGFKDLLVGREDGGIDVYYNTDDYYPNFEAGVPVVVGLPPYANLDVGHRAYPSIADFDSDGYNDIVSGCLSGTVNVFFNTGYPAAEPVLFYDIDGYPAQQDGVDLVIPNLYSSPVLVDLNFDGKKDLLSGDQWGNIWYYINIGTDEWPWFGSPQALRSENVPIDLGNYSHPRLCDWTGDGYTDLIAGSNDGKVHLFQSIGQTGDTDKDYDVDFVDFAVLAAAWHSQPGDVNWNKHCDLNEPKDDTIDEADLQVLSSYWLAGVE